MSLCERHDANGRPQDTAGVDICDDEELLIRGEDGFRDKSLVSGVLRLQADRPRSGGAFVAPARCRCR